MLILSWETERQNMRDKERETESEAGSRLWAVNTEPDMGLEFMNWDHDLSPSAQVGRLPNWATQVPPYCLKSNLFTIALVLDNSSPPPTLFCCDKHCDEHFYSWVCSNLCFFLVDLRDIKTDILLMLDCALDVYPFVFLQNRYIFSVPVLSILSVELSPWFFPSPPKAPCSYPPHTYMYQVWKWGQIFVEDGLVHSGVTSWLRSGLEHCLVPPCARPKVGLN